MTFCPGCGKKLKSKERFCLDCKPKNDLKIKDIIIKICSSCKKYFHNGTWVKYDDLKTVLIKVVKKNIKRDKTNLYFNPVLSDILVKPGIKKSFSLEISNDDELYIIPWILEVTYCNNCSKAQGDYFEGVLQLRKVPDEVYTFVKSYLKENKVYIAKEKKQPNGIDLTVTDQRKVQGLGRLLHKKYGGILKISPRIYSKDKQTSKDIYRVTVFYEGPVYNLDEVVKIADKLVLIKKITKNIIGVELKTGKRVSVNLKNKEYSILKPVKAIVSKINPHIEILDPETFQSVPIKNTKKVMQGEKVNMIKDSGLYYVF